MKFGIYTRYDSLGASSRCRYLRFLPSFRRNNLEGEVHSFFSNSYLRKLYSGDGKSRTAGFIALCKRLFTLLFCREKNMLIEYELLPNVPYCIEKFFLRNVRYVLNFDDNVWEKYANRRSLAGKYDALVRHASGVIAANDFLLKKVEKLNSNVCLIPTVVANDALVTGSPEKFPVLTLIWIGTPVTYAYVEDAAEILRAMAQCCDFELLILARKSLESRAIDGVRMRFEDWSEEAEHELLCKSHAGIMPLPADDAFAAGKSAYKLIQYHAAGIPAIASPVGENCRVIHNGVDGILASSVTDWCNALLLFAQDKEAYARMSENARRNGRDFSVAAYAGKYCDFLKEAFEKE